MEFKVGDYVICTKQFSSVFTKNNTYHVVYVDDDEVNIAESLNSGKIISLEKRKILDNALDEIEISKDKDVKLTLQYFVDTDLSKRKYIEDYFITKDELRRRKLEKLDKLNGL